MTQEKQLMLLNDSVHSYDYVKACILKYVHPFSFIQAEQLVTIAHHTGRASIKVSDDILDLIKIQEDLESKGLKTEII
jgi:ATP-dependent Clp protease adapter protein ClpS